MARRISYTAPFPHHTPVQVWRAMRTPALWEARLDELRVWSRNELVSLDVRETSIELIFNHIIPRELMPELARAVMRKDMIVTRNEHYEFDGTRITGHSAASIPNGPGSLTSMSETVASGRGSVYTTTAEAQVHIPLLGLQIEKLMLDRLQELVVTEASATAAWLVNNSALLV